MTIRFWRCKKPPLLLKKSWMTKLNQPRKKGHHLPMKSNRHLTKDLLQWYLKKKLRMLWRMPTSEFLRKKILTVWSLTLPGLNLLNLASWRWSSVLMALEAYLWSIIGIRKVQTYKRLMYIFANYGNTGCGVFKWGVQN